MIRLYVEICSLPKLGLYVLYQFSWLSRQYTTAGIHFVTRTNNWRTADWRGMACLFLKCFYTIIGLDCLPILHYWCGIIWTKICQSDVKLVFALWCCRSFEHIVSHVRVALTSHVSVKRHEVLSRVEYVDSRPGHHLPFNGSQNMHPLVLRSIHFRWYGN